jgi:hypothetical protein
MVGTLLSVVEEEWTVCQCSAFFGFSIKILRSAKLALMGSRMSLLQKDLAIVLWSRLLEGHEQDQRCTVDPVLIGVLKRGWIKGCPPQVSMIQG